mmetsp:Transcript_44558/g.125778  ORF Transcript_44558/g.125778 Transcript_44558/m.125778 type:complete len:240 (-) Transcript_44558:573-1292(-)
MRPLDLEAQLRPQRHGHELQGLNSALGQRLPARQLLLRLLLHGDGDVRRHAVLPEVSPQHAHHPRLPLLPHAVVHHRRRKHGDHGAPKHKPKHHRQDEDGPLARVRRADVQAAECDLPGGPAKGHHVLVLQRGVAQGRALAPVVPHTVHPPLPGVAVRHGASDIPGASQEVGRPHDAEEEAENAERKPDTVGHRVRGRQPLNDVHSAPDPSQGHGAEEPGQLGHPQHLRSSVTDEAAVG